MELWRKVWRDGLLPQLSHHALHALQQALIRDDDRLLQGATTSPPALDVLADCEVEAACALCYCAWQGEGRRTIGEVVREFDRICQAADTLLGEPASCRWFLDWFDLTPRTQVRRELRAEVERALAERRAAAA
jgi:hypothetical protein